MAIYLEIQVVMHIVIVFRLKNGTICFTQTFLGKNAVKLGPLELTLPSCRLRVERKRHKPG